MDLHTQIKEELKSALKAHDAVKLRTVRSMLTAFMNELVATGHTPQTMLDDAGVLTVIKRLSKQRKDSIQQFEAGNRADLAGVEKEELAVLESYLPQMMSQDDIRPIVEAKIAELGVAESRRFRCESGCRRSTWKEVILSAV